MRLFVKQLTIMDFSYLDPEQGLLGESWNVDIELEGQLDEQGMLLDFGDVKAQVKQVINQHFDHKLLVPGAYKGLDISTERNLDTLTFSFLNGQQITQRAPGDATTVIDADRITTDSVARAIELTLRKILPANVKNIHLKLYAEHIEGAWYQYSHGLKQHCGNCQRIAHGHRSRIEIFRNGSRDAALENQWAKLFRNIYLANKEDLQEQTKMGGIDYYRFSYHAEQGAFELLLPKQQCYLLNTETTVENIAQHIAWKLAEEYPNDAIEVHAFEGVGKGAISSYKP